MTIVMAAGFALIAVLSAAPAQAQRDRVFVASYGSDSNPCTFGSPCKTFQQAVNVVAGGGEVTAIDSAGFGPVTISHAVTITSPAGVEAGIAAMSGGNAITISAGTNDAISISGMVLDGAARAANNGIQFNSGGSLNVQDCTIRNFANDGILFEPNGTSQLFVTNALLAGNEVDGIDINPTNTGAVTGTIERVRSQSNGQQGVAIGAASNAMTLTIGSSVIADNTASGISVGAATGLNLTVSDSTIANNGGSGIFSNAATSDIMVTATKIANNSVFGVLVSGSTTIWLTRSTLTGNNNGSGTESSGSLFTFGDNAVAGNSNGNGAGASIPYK